LKTSDTSLSAGRLWSKFTDHGVPRLRLTNVSYSAQTLRDGLRMNEPLIREAPAQHPAFLTPHGHTVAARRGATMRRDPHVRRTLSTNDCFLTILARRSSFLTPVFVPRTLLMLLKLLASVPPVALYKRTLSHTAREAREI